MSTLTAIVQWIINNYKKSIMILVAFLTAIVMVLKLIPSQPGVTEIQSAIDTLEKIEGN